MRKVRLGRRTTRYVAAGSTADPPTRPTAIQWPAYAERKLAQGYPEIERLGGEYFSGHQSTTSDVLKTMQRIGRLVELNEHSKVLVIGCGPNPQAIKVLLDAGFIASGVEPVGYHVEAAARFLGATGLVTLGTAENLQVEDESQDAVIMESVLEHVDSAHKSLAEAFRVLRPGGVLYVSTTNRWRFSPTGHNGEFNVAFYNWLPAVVKESYVFRHLHYDPYLANYTPRPAVHWFGFADLCAFGRQAGFGAFYSFLDLIDETSDHSVASHPAKSWIVRNVRQHPWFRALVLSQLAGTTVFMYKRVDAANVATHS